MSAPSSSPSSVISTTSVAVLLVPARTAGCVIEFLISSSRSTGESPFVDLAADDAVTASAFTEVEEIALAVPATGRPEAVVGRRPAGDRVRGVEEDGPGVEGLEAPSFSFPLDRRDCL